MKDFWRIAFGVVCGLLGAGIILLASSRPRGQAITLLPPPSPPPLTIHVAGEVAQPGVYSLPIKSRVQDAIQAAGGLLPAADTQSLNLAAVLQDGEKVLVPAVLPTPTPTEIPNRSASVPALSSTITATPGLININTATQAELESLPGIGPALAQQIIAYRKANGPFARIEDIVDVPGIGPKTFEKIKDLITVGN